MAIPQNLSSSLEHLEVFYSGFEDTVIGPEMFARYSRLTSLSIYGYHITSLGENVFKNLEFLVSLSVRSTLVNTLPPGFIPNNSLIVTLDLYNNRLTELPYHLFDQMPRLSKLNLAFNRIVLDDCSSIGPGFEKLTNLTYLTITNLTVAPTCMRNVSKNFFQPIQDTVKALNLTMSNIYEGDPRIFKDFAVLETLDISLANGLKYCPSMASSLFDNMPDSLVRLAMRRWRTKSTTDSQCFINATTLASLKKLPKLSSIDMKYSDLIFGTELNRSVFDGFKQLTTLNIAWCRFSSVESYAFDGCPSLKSLSLDGNPLGSRPLHLFRNISSSQLVYLKLSKANLYSDYSKNYHASNLLLNSPLKRINLKHNYLTRMPSFLTENRTVLGSLEALHLDYNFLENLYLKTSDVHLGAQCQYLPNLANISLSHNKIRKIIGLSQCRKIKVLDLSYNSLSIHWSEINAKEISNMETLEKLDLSFNNLNRLSKQAFARMYALKVLHLVGNNFTTVTAEHFQNNLLLEVLDLRGNFIRSFPASIVTNLKNMSQLLLDDNRITKITFELVKYFESVNGTMKVFGLIGNPLLCSCSQVFLQRWIKSTSNIIPQANQLKCYGPTEELKGKRVYNYKRDNFYCDYSAALKASGFALGGIILALLIGLPCYKYRWYVTHARVVVRAILNHISALKIEHNCQYDAYVMYNSESEDDQQWVVGDLRLAVENNSQVFQSRLKLVFHCCNLALREKTCCANVLPNFATTKN